MTQPSPQIWTRALELVDRALDECPDDPQAFVEGLSGVDPEVAALTLSILRKGSDDEGLLDAGLERITHDALASLGASPSEGLRLGNYIVHEEIGRGGMGVVHRATRADAEFDDEVVVKILPPAMDTPQRRARFVLERQLLARLRHPHIAQLIDGGLTPSGQPYFVLEHVAGLPIDRAADARDLGLRARLRLFLSVLEAVDHAHRNLVVHRDIKPSNVLVTEDGHVKLLDFGIAKVLEDDEPTLTRTGIPMLTPEYASPEQVRGQTVTTAADVYQLGLLLHLLLTGEAPQSEASDSIASLERVVCRTEVDLASRVCRKAWKKQLRGDLDRILQRALAKDPARRYSTADAMAEDLRRHLDGLPIAARGDSAAYRLSKFVTRHPAWTTVVLLIAVGLPIFGVVDTTRVRHERDRAQLEAQQKQQVADLLAGLFDMAGEDPARVSTVTARELLERGAHRLRDELSDQPRLRSRMLVVVGDAATRVGLYETALPLLTEADSLSAASFGATSTEHAEAVRQLAELQQLRRNFSEAVRAWERYLPLVASDPGSRADHAHALHQLGAAEIALDRLDAGEQHLTAALEALETGDPAARIGIETDLAGLARRQQNWSLAETRYRQALRHARQENGRGADVDIGPILNDLAFLLRTQERFDEAADYYRECATLLEQRLGPGHPTTVMVRDNLAAVLEQLDQDESLEHLLEETLTRVRTFQADENWRVAVAEINLARVRRHRGELESATAGFERAETILARELGIDHAWTVCACLDRVVCHALAGENVDTATDSLASRVPIAVEAVPRLFEVRGAHCAEDLRSAGHDEFAAVVESWTHRQASGDRR